jgi:alpha-beta hydrolase superfamily lysophospholipase
MPFIAPDLRGHGRSGGTRGEMAEPHVLRADLGTVIGLCDRQFADSPVVLMGESMGGLIAADYAWRGERRLAGLALLVPAFAVHKSQIKLESLVKALSGKVLLADEAKLAPSTREPGFVAARKADKLALREVKLSYLTALSAMQRDWPRAAAEVKCPLYIALAGKDRIIDAHVTREVFEQAGTPKAQKTLRQWDDAFHTLCWDPQTPQVMDDVARWAVGLGNGKR